MHQESLCSVPSVFAGTTLVEMPSSDQLDCIAITSNNGWYALCSAKCQLLSSVQGNRFSPQPSFMVNPTFRPSDDLPELQEVMR
ncbi:PREDICTED: uncharacterized protein LOC107544413 isoform X6 [Miniopterus natalensis]|uniref:uncharacterized protein LOC107544413 isoform X6 n=1 Tax=Miniopterus natalensis TaxID=291302 RepID=UPI0007A711DA|nr:PREDICTED: uncharacterized protein LOC107544413 isoform X6 [Miniopterus natalensis]